MKKLFKAWVVYEGKTLFLKKEKKVVRESMYILAESEKDARIKFCNTVEFNIMIKNRGRITNTGYVDCPKIRVEKSRVEFSRDFDTPTIKELANLLNADDFLEYCKDRLDINTIMGL